MTVLTSTEVDELRVLIEQLSRKHGSDDVWSVVFQITQRDDGQWQYWNGGWYIGPFDSAKAALVAVFERAPE